MYMQFSKTVRGAISSFNNTKKSGKIVEALNHEYITLIFLYHCP